MRFLVLLLLLGCESSTPGATPEADAQAPSDAAAVDGASPDAAAADDAGVEPDAALPPARLVLNEIDCRGRDWIELSNLGPGTELDGWRLTDDVERPERAYALTGALGIAAFGRVRQQTSAEDGFTFGVACQGDTISLIDPEGQVVDATQPELPGGGLTWGRLPDASGEWQPTTPTPEAPNEPAPDASSLFDSGRVMQIDLTLAPGGAAALEEDPRVYVEGTLSLDGGAPMAVGLRLKGRLGSFRGLDDKSAFKVGIDHVEGGQRLLGLKTLTLNNMVQDPSLVREWLSYRLFRSVGVAAPRVGHAFVTLDGAPMGLYAHVETPDEVALAAWFGEVGELYEGTYGQDLRPEDVFALDQDAGGDGREALAALAALTSEVPPPEYYAATAELIDWPQALRMMATEVFVGHWDGYAPSSNNYFFHFADGVLRLMPWGTDQTFEAPLALHEGNGRIFRRCLASQACRLAYAEALGAVVEAAREIDPMEVRLLGAALRGWLRPEARDETHEERALRNVEETLEFLEWRLATVGEELSCLGGDAPDGDGDGFACAEDCDDEDPTIFPGARDLCGDGVDQDCNGRPDDGPDCPDCVPVEDGRYLICTRERPFQEAREACLAEGAHMVIIGSPPEAERVVELALSVWPNHYWIGLSDVAREGRFRWVDGSEMRYEHWDEGEPNDAGGGEDCVHFYGHNGRWNDIPCEAELPVVCERSD